jgi:thiol:disulfide interchange protein
MIIRFLSVLGTFLVFGALCINAQTATGANPQPAGSSVAAPAQARAESATGDGFVPVTKFDPARDAVTDIKLAVNEAARTGKRVLMDVGGEWCIWCHRMDDFFTANPALLKFRDTNFVLVKVNVSDENKNEELLASYGTVAGYPHLFVLDSGGAVLHSQDTGLLEDGQKSYTLSKVEAFLKEWASPVK